MTAKNTKFKKRIFWFEDDAHSLSDYYEKLSQEYYVSIGAHRDLIEQKRDYSFDLVLLDLMIHKSSFEYKSNKEVKNISYDETHWSIIGVEFLKRLRKGEYESYGFPHDIPVIAATALVDSDIQETVEHMDVNDFLVKPFTIDKLKVAIEKALNPSKITEG